MTAQEFVELLDLRGLDPRPVGPGRWSARCPSHDDRTPSLSVGVGDDGRPLWKCFAGCDQLAVRDALKLGARSTANGRAPRRPAEPAPVAFNEDLVHQWHAALHHDLRPSHIARVSARLRDRRWQWRVLDRAHVGWHGGRFTFPCRNASGALTGVTRYTTTPGRSAKSVAIRGSHRDLFPRLEGMRSDVLWVAEGEPDALALLSAGVAAVGVPGVSGWKPQWAERFVGRRYVIVAMDCDSVGREAAQRIVGDLLGVGVDACVIDLDPRRNDGWDLTDFVAEVAAAGENVLTALAALTEGAP